MGTEPVTITTSSGKEPIAKRRVNTTKEDGTKQEVDRPHPHARKLPSQAALVRRVPPAVKHIISLVKLKDTPFIEKGKRVDVSSPPRRKNANSRAGARAQENSFRSNERYWMASRMS